MSMTLSRIPVARVETRREQLQQSKGEQKKRLGLSRNISKLWTRIDRNHHLKMKTWFVIVVVVLTGILGFEAEATDCYRCAYTKGDNELVDSTLNAALARLGIDNDATCQTNPSNEIVGKCPVVDASCGTVQATLSLNVELAGQAIPVEMAVFSRDCFPDDTNPGVDDTTAGCYKADDYEEFFSKRFLIGLQSVQGLKAQLKGQQGCICFCDDEDLCNDQTTLKNEQNECFQNDQNDQNQTITTTKPGRAVNSALNLSLDVLSRDCFPDDTNPGVNKTVAGCYKADDYEEFISQSVLSA